MTVEEANRTGEQAVEKLKQKGGQAVERVQETMQEAFAGRRSPCEWPRPALDLPGKARTSRPIS